MKVSSKFGAWLGIGVGAGTAIGVSTHHIAMWLAIGIAYAFAMDAISRRKERIRS